MRPIRLEMEGFSTFRAHTEVEFDDLDLVAFVGPTGSGKSSIIDAITFALYGSVARYDDVRLVQPVITQNANEAKVRLDFEVAGQTHTAVRIVRRTKTGATTKEARLERGDDVLASGAKELSSAIEELLGLDFVQFTRTVVLPQGDFAQFLKDDPASRQRLLTRLLDLQLYSRMGTRSRERAKAAGHRASAISEQLERHADITPKALAAAQAVVGRLDEFAVKAHDALRDVAELDTELVGLRDERKLLVEQLDVLAGLAVPDDVVDAGPRLTSAREHRDATRLVLDNTRAARDELDESVGAIASPADLATAIETAKRVDELRAEIAQLADQQSTLAEAKAAAEASLAELTDHHERAVATLAAARRSADAGQWLASLVEGEPCPVCRQDVESIPDHDPDAELSAAMGSEKELSEQVRTSRQAIEAGAGQLATTSSRLDDRKAELERVRERLRPEPIEELVELHTQANAAASKRLALADELRAAEKAADDARTRVEALEDGERRHRVACTTLRDSVATLDPPALDGDTLVADWTALATWAEVAIATRGERQEAITTSGKALRSRRDEMVNNVLGEANELGLRLDASTIVDDLADDLVRARTEANAKVATIETRLAEVDELRAEVKARTEERDVYELLGRQLSANGFEQWLLAEAVDDLVARATDVLKELSNGQFSLSSDDRSFTIIDHRNADLERDVRTLSGGETFLASLALALALSDSIAELAPVDAPRLGSMFLDEGFGTLDPETLDTVATAIEELSATGRLVGIVTHIEALAERMPARYVVNKGADTSTVKRVLA